MKSYSAGYYSHIRFDLLSLLPKGATIDAALDIGCGAGVTGELLKKQYGAQFVIGLEMDADAAEAARRRLDQVITGSAEQEDLPFAAAQFDLIVMGDVLEHLIDPWRALARFATYLKPQGILLCSIPNVQHWRTPLQLFRGRWEYTAGGTLDRTHLRFFTRRSIKAMFRDAGLKIIHLHSKMGIESRVLNYLTFKRLNGLFAYQYLILASKER